MDLDDAVVSCAINIQWTNSSGEVGRKIAHKIATLRLIRNDLRELYLEISVDKCKPIVFHLKDVIVHKKFMSEGKATINFKREQCMVYLSNAPPGTLMLFLKKVFIKLNGAECKEQLDEMTVQKQLRAHMLSGEPSRFEEVSPVTTAEMIMARRKAGIRSQSNTTSPLSQTLSRKRRFNELDSTYGEHIQPKKLYSDPEADLKRKTVNVVDDLSISLNEEQSEVLKMCVAGKSVFFTGSAGTGKSFLMRKIISALPPEGTVATASTGVAACLIGNANHIYIYLFI